MEKQSLTDEQQVGRKIRELRKSRGMTQEDPATEISETCTGKVISRYETGRDEMKMLTFFDICSSLGCTPNDIAPDWILGNGVAGPEGYNELSTDNKTIINKMIQALLLQQSNS